MTHSQIQFNQFNGLEQTYEKTDERGWAYGLLMIPVSIPFLITVVLMKELIGMKQLRVAYARQKGSFKLVLKGF